MRRFIYNKLWALPLILSLVLAGCSDDDYLGGHSVKDGAGVQMTLTGEINAQSEPSLAWAEGDVIGVAASSGLYDASVRNREYVCDADGKTFVNVSGLPMYVKGNVKIVAYYPFVGTDGGEQTIQLNTLDQDNITDFLFARAENVNKENGSNVNLVFDYALARVRFNITVPDGEVITTCRITGLAQQATADPYTLDLTLDAPEDLVVTGTNIKTLSLKLIPQEISETPEIPAQLVLIGTKRSYVIDLSGLSLAEGEVKTANVDASDGVATIEFVPNGAAWDDSGAGGDYSSN